MASNKKGARQMNEYHITWLRIKQDVWEQICLEANKQNRSYSNMIGTILKDYFKRGGNDDIRK